MEIEEIKQVISTMTILTIKVINFVKLHYVLKDLLMKEKWFLFLPHGVDLKRGVARVSCS